MRKKIIIDTKAEKELRRFSGKVQIKLESYLKILREEGNLRFPESRKIERKLWELRIKYKGEYRGLYSYIEETYIIILLFFKKKSQKTPLKFIKTAKKRLREYE